MGVKLTIEAETPLSADDRDILAGISAFVYAVANRDDLAEQPPVQDEEQPYCGSVAPTRAAPASARSATRVATSTDRSTAW